MINYQVFGLIGWLQLLEQERRICREKTEALMAVNQMTPAEAERVHPNQYQITDQDRARLEGLLSYAEQLCKELSLTGTENRIVRFRQSIRTNPFSPVTNGQQLKTLFEALQDDLHLKYFYFYPDDRARRILRVDADWAAAFGAFPSIKEDTKSAVDCYALGHHNACVFGCVMVLEKGLKALAADVGLTFEAQQWKGILDEIEAAIGKIRSHGISGMEKATKDARLQFLSEAAKDFFYFKDAWRNYVAHGHARYDEDQTLGVLEHTRSFMNHLASKLSEAA